MGIEWQAPRASAEELYGREDRWRRELKAQETLELQKDIASLELEERRQDTFLALAAAAARGEIPYDGSIFEARDEAVAAGVNAKPPDYYVTL